MKVEVIMPIDLRYRRSVPTRITGLVDEFQCNGEPSTSRKPSRHVLKRYARWNRARG
jgi:hypothetical protein